MENRETQKPLKIQFLYFPGCPNAPAARQALDQALKCLGCDPGAIEAVDVRSQKTPRDLKGYPSPSILVNGRDLEGTPPGDAAACRIYIGAKGVLEPRTILAALNKILY